MAPNIQMMMKALKVPRQYPLRIESFFNWSAEAWYRSFSKTSLVKDLTDMMPLSDSSTMTLLAAVVSWSSLDFFLKNRPKMSATMMMAGKVASIKTANFDDV